MTKSTQLPVCDFTGHSYLAALSKHLALTTSRYGDKNKCIPLAKYLGISVLTAASDL